MNGKRSTPVLLLGFGLLIGLIAVTGIGALQRARETYRDELQLNQRYRRTDRVLSGVASRLYRVAILTRDYLLDPSNTRAAEYRADLVGERTAMDKELAELEGLVLKANQPEFVRLRAEVSAYCDVLDPLFEWTEVEKAQRSWSFLRKEVLPRRSAAMEIAREFSRLTEANLDEQRREIDRKQAAMASFILRMLAVTVLIGLAVACVAVLRNTGLERQSKKQCARAEDAERELRRLSRQLVNAQEAERKSISRELHDEIGQMLTGLRMELRSLQELRTAEEEFNIHLDGAKRLAEQSMRCLRDIAMGLRPSLLDDLGLGPAVQWQARQFSKHTGIPVNVDVGGLRDGLPEQHRICIYRIVQEALTNCARHARASIIDIMIRDSGGSISVTVVDNGIGFDPSGVKGQGLGLTGMHERIMDLGGELILAAGPARGTILTAEIPVGTEALRNEYSHSVSG
ncbi:MAG: sensor histidine kinase [Candidatus Solibacter sp.]